MPISDLLVCDRPSVDARLARPASGNHKSKMIVPIYPNELTFLLSEKETVNFHEM
jgi:hypothetical protein